MNGGRRRLAPVGVVIAGSLVLDQSGVAALEVEFPLESAHVIASEAGVFRIVFDFGVLEQVHDELVTSAHVRIALPNRAPGEDIDLVLYGLSTPWRGTVPTWTSPWATPGGDVDESASSTVVTLDEGEPVSFLRLDVTHLVRGMLVGDVAANGFIMTTPRGGFSERQMIVWGDTIRSGDLVVNYRKLTALGIHDGGRERLDRKRGQ
jgi:hypothetical protein